MKKTIKFLLLLLVFASCSSIRVNSDFDKNVNFSEFKTYAYYKTGIDKVDLSDLDKKRILRSVDEVMSAKGYTKSETPDVLVTFFTKERENVSINQFDSGWGFGWNYGWNPYGWGVVTSVSRYTEGILYIDIMSTKTKEVIWQGQGEGVLTKDTYKKDENIKEFVTKILEQFPPDTNKK
jgi:hypothetical protein